MNVALLGFGVVGKGVYDILVDNHLNIHVKYILEKNDNLLTNLMHLKANDIETILNDASIDVVIELIGGKGVAYQFVKQALQHQLHVVTANKALISAHFKELHDLASKHHVNLLYEASVGGAIIALDPLRHMRYANPVHEIKGIINGATNFVLTKIFLENTSLDDALKKALQLGYLETGSTDDMDGLDLMRKINILSMLAYETYIDESKILNMPLSRLTSSFMTYIKSKGLILKYVAYSARIDDDINIYLTPTILSKDHLYSHINNEFNIIDVYGRYHHHQSFIGQGAGRYPTASAVVYDLLTMNFEQPLVEIYKKQYHVNEQPFNHQYVVQYQDDRIEKVYTSLAHILNDKHIVCAARIGEDCYDAL